MDPIFQVIIVIFFGVFLAFGGVWLGAGGRSLFEDQSKAIGLIGSGAVFAGVATLMSGVFLHSINPWLFYTDLAVLALAILGGALFPREYLHEIGIGTIIALGLGGVGTAVGALVAAFGLKNWHALSSEDIVFGVLFSGCWITVGLGFFVTGLGALLRGQALQMRPGRGGSMELVLPETGEPETTRSRPRKRARKQE